MLVLSRKAGERIDIRDGQITVTVVAIQGNVVRLGIDAPSETSIHRQEIWQKLQPTAISPGVPKPGESLTIEWERTDFGH
ncbi:carbon storage regulator [Planctomicrobium piriforme]|uniref:Translational regulator CsrA n=1 Tax=Planctomicrobium piriforme TaxID=1576369 RepID=A0A1I3RMV8_9PLAN|nr:carbon storage regulator [Planctomicrobium piriforme]SFJ46597.1 carbon storage regulator [Planctomicrobium piriforme]